MDTDPTGLDLRALSVWLDGVLVGGCAGRLQARMIHGGRSNLTYEVTDGVSVWVLRRPPLGHVLATAHDMGREYRVMSALRDSDVPVPETVACCDDEAVLGAPFYVMAKVDGRVYRTTGDVATLSADDAKACAGSLIDVLAGLHRVEVAAVGLADFGRPDGYLQRQVRRWGRQLADSTTREVAGLAVLAERVGARLPESQRAAIVHGDYRLDNVIVADPAHGEIAAVLDWEMATLGDPLADLGLFLVYWDGLGSIDNPITARLSGHPGLPSGAELIARYGEQAGLALDDLDWYVAFGYYKLAVILEGIHCRYMQGLTVGDDFEQVGAMVPELVERGLDPNASGL